MPKLKRAAIRALAAEIVQKHGEVVGVRRQVEALINSLGDTLSDREIFEELQAINHNGPWIDVFASVNQAERDT